MHPLLRSRRASAAARKCRVAGSVWGTPSRRSGRGLDTPIPHYWDSASRTQKWTACSFGGSGLASVPSARSPLSRFRSFVPRLAVRGRRRTDRRAAASSRKVGASEEPWSPQALVHAMVGAGEQVGGQLRVQVGGLARRRREVPRQGERVRGPHPNHHAARQPARTAARASGSCRRRSGCRRR